jgi:predicted Zn-ribbon and HTH transcriptional regulator
MREQPAQPKERGETARQALRGALRGELLTTKELSARTSISEREVSEHLMHLEKSLAREGSALIVEHAACAACGFRFTKRERMARPSRCPRCKSERIHPPRYGLPRTP